MRTREKRLTQEPSTADLKASLAAPSVSERDRDTQYNRGRRRLGHLGLASVAGLTAGAVITTGIVFGPKVFGGDRVPEGDRNTNPTATSTPLSELEPVSLPEYMLDLDSSDPLAAKGALSNKLADLVNARLHGGGEESNPDLSYIATPEGVSDVQKFVTQAVDKVWEAEKTTGQKNLSLGIGIGEPESVKPLENGGFVVVADTTYIALDSAGNPLGYASGNAETYTYEFAPVSYEIDGEEIHTYAVNGIDEVDLRP